jgi:hypothetical protein
MKHLHAVALMVVVSNLLAPGCDCGTRFDDRFDELCRQGLCFDAGDSAAGGAPGGGVVSGGVAGGISTNGGGMGGGASGGVPTRGSRAASLGARCAA